MIKLDQRQSAILMLIEISRYRVKGMPITEFVNKYDHDTVTQQLYWLESNELVTSSTSFSTEEYGEGDSETYAHITEQGEFFVGLMNDIDLKGLL